MWPMTTYSGTTKIIPYIQPTATLIFPRQTTVLPYKYVDFTVINDTISHIISYICLVTHA